MLSKFAAAIIALVLLYFSFSCLGGGCLLQGPTLGVRGNVWKKFY